LDRRNNNDDEANKFPHLGKDQIGKRASVLANYKSLPTIILLLSQSYVRLDLEIRLKGWPND
jgi:hypothetical protein